MWETLNSIHWDILLLTEMGAQPSLLNPFIMTLSDLGVRQHTQTWGQVRRGQEKNEPSECLNIWAIDSAFWRPAHRLLTALLPPWEDCCCTLPWKREAQAPAVVRMCVHVIVCVKGIARQSGMPPFTQCPAECVASCLADWKGVFKHT